MCKGAGWPGLRWLARAALAPAPATNLARLQGGQVSLRGSQSSQKQRRSCACLPLASLQVLFRVALALLKLHEPLLLAQVRCLV